MQKTIARSKLAPVLQQLKGKIFGVCWIKKSGEVRCANVRKGVYKKKKGNGKGLASIANSYITVYLMWQMNGRTFDAESGYRVINLDTVKYISINGNTYKVTPTAKSKDEKLIA